MKKVVFPFSKIEKILLLFCGVGFFFSVIGISWAYYEEHSDLQTAYGGTYTEGVIGSGADFLLNPVYLYGKRDQSVESDVANLLFSGLMKFDASTGKIEDYIASHTLSADKKIYTFRLKDGLLWHDGAPLTVDDVIFTYKEVISHEDFSNDALRRAFASVEIEKVNDLEVTFTLQYPYKFFLTNFTVGILPKHILGEVPVAEMEYHDFSLNPVGSGAFQYDSLEEVRPNIFKLKLTAFRSSSLGDPKLDAIEFMIYPSRNALSLDSHKLDGIRPFPEKNKDLYFIDNTLQEKTFALPQYSALFFNLQKDILKGTDGHKIRTGLRLATNKDLLMETVPSVRIDTPLLEITEGEWEYEYAPEKANGAFKDAGYYFPSKKPKTIAPEKSSEKWITRPTRKPEWIETQKEVQLMGIFPSKGRSLKLFWSIAGSEEEVKEIWSHEKENIRIDNEEWKFDFVREDSFINKRGELRIIFYDKNKKQIKEDALSFYWEDSGEKTSDSDSIKDDIIDEKKDTSEDLENRETSDETPQEEAVAHEENNENKATEENESNENETPLIENTQASQDNTDVKIGDEPGNQEKQDESAEEEKNEKKAFDSLEKNATNEGEISLEESIPQDEIRETLSGEPLQLTLLTSEQPAYYAEVADHLKNDWKTMGVDLHVKVLPMQEFYEGVSHREYDILLYGQNLGYNLDIYEFFHGTQVGKDNLSDYKSQQANVLIQEIRSSHVPEVRAKKLEELKQVLKRDIPAIFLFSPTYQYYHNPGVQGMDIPYIAFLRDRFSTADEWYIEKDRSFQEGESWGGLIPWFTQKYISFITFSL